MTGDAWTFPAAGIDQLTVHPVHILDPDDYALLRLHAAHESGHLPEAGGALDQAACTMDSLAAIGGTLAALRAERAADGRSPGQARG